MQHVNEKNFNIFFFNSITSCKELDGWNIRKYNIHL